MKNKTVLIVDDEPHIGAVIAGKLREAGARVMTARDGREALRVCKDHPFDLILVDLSMPRMDGAALIDALRRLPAMAEVPVLILTGLGHTLDRSRFSHANLAGVIAKPFSPRDLVERVQRALADSSSRVPARLVPAQPPAPSARRSAA